jgi:hypothetical protein
LFKKASTDQRYLLLAAKAKAAEDLKADAIRKFARIS